PDSTTWSTPTAPCAAAACGSSHWKPPSTASPRAPTPTSPRSTTTARPTPPPSRPATHTSCGSPAGPSASSTASSATTDTRRPPAMSAEVVIAVAGTAVAAYHLGASGVLPHARRRLRYRFGSAVNSGLRKPTTHPARWTAEAVTYIDAGLSVDRKSTRLNSSHVKISY